jgi:hypothetical protein
MRLSSAAAQGLLGLGAAMQQHQRLKVAFDCGGVVLGQQAAWKKRRQTSALAGASSSSSS